MKIAYIGQKGIPGQSGGVEMHVETLALGMRAEGHDVYVYCRRWYLPEPANSYKGIKLIYRPSWRTKNLDTITHVWFSTWHAMRQKFDIIHYHGVGPALLSWLPRLFCPKTKVVVTFHSIDRLHKKWGAVARWLLRLGEYCAVHYAHATITVSRGLKAYCEKKFHKKVIYIPNGIYQYEKKPAKLITENWGLNGNDYIFFMSRLVRHKGIHYLMEAYKSLKQTDKKLVIVGGGSFSDEYVRHIEHLAKEDPRVIMVGEVPMKSDLWLELFSNAYLFVLPSEYEGLSIVVLEAMSFGRCVLVSDIPENLESIAGGVGFSFKNKDVANLRLQLRYLLDNSKIVEQVGNAARTMVLEHYHWDKIIKATEFVYRVLWKKASQEDFEKYLQPFNQPRV